MLLKKRAKSATFLRCQNASTNPIFLNLGFTLDTKITKIDTKISKFTMLRGPKRCQQNGPFGIAKKSSKVRQKIGKKLLKNHQKIALVSEMRCAHAFQDRGCDPELFIKI